VLDVDLSAPPHRYRPTDIAGDWRRPLPPHGRCGPAPPILRAARVPPLGIGHPPRPSDGAPPRRRCAHRLARRQRCRGRTQFSRARAAAIRIQTGAWNRHRPKSAWPKHSARNR
jgi:hypothetical protein